MIDYVIKCYVVVLSTIWAHPDILTKVLLSSDLWQKDKFSPHLTPAAIREGILIRRKNTKNSTLNYGNTTDGC